MAISFGAHGAYDYSASGGTSIAPPYPTGITSGHLLLLFVGQKPSTANSGTCDTPTGWTLAGSKLAAGGYTTTLGADTGNTNLFVFYKIATGSESGSLSVTVGTNNIAWAKIVRLASDTSSLWAVGVATGEDSSAGAFSATMDTNPGIKSGDFLLGGLCIPTDVSTPTQFSVPTFAATGATISAGTEIEEADSGTGNDIGGLLAYAPVTAGTASSAPTFSATTGGTTTNVRGPAAVVRVREVLSITDNTSSYVHGYATILDNHSSFIGGFQALSDNHSAYIEGTPNEIVERNASFYTYSNIGYDVVSTKEGNHYHYSFVNQLTILTSTKLAFMEGFQPSVSDTQPSFISGPFSSTSSFGPGAFIYGRGRVEQSHWAHIRGSLPILDNTLCFIHGSGTSITDTQLSFIRVAEPASDSHSVYLHSATQALDGHDLFISGHNISDYGALSFNSANSQRVEITGAPFYNGLEKFTLNVWVRNPTGATSTYDAVIVKGLAPSSQSLGIYRRRDTSKFHFGVNTGTWTAQDSVGAYTANAWGMATVVYDGVNCKFYLNGAFDSQFAKTGAVLLDSRNITLAYRQDNGTYTSVDIADITMWNYALTPTEIEDLYHSNFIKSSISSYINGTTATAITDQTHLYVNSASAPTNPFTIISSQRCVIDGGSIVDSQNIYLVASPVNTDTFDTKIILDDFRTDTFDMVIRVVVQGERARRFQEADIEYPITREKFRDLPNIFYSDIPGRQFSNTTAYIHAGWAVGSHEGDISGANPNISPRIQRAYIPAIKFTGGFKIAYLHGHFTPISDTHNVYISSSPSSNSNISLFMSGRNLLSLDDNQGCYVVGVGNPIEDQLGQGFIHGWGIMEDSQPVMIRGPVLTGGFKPAYIHALNVTSRSSLKHIYVRASILIVRSHNLYMNAHQFGFDDFQPCFVHAQPTAISSRNCFIKCATPFINETPRRALVSGNAPITDSHGCHISSDLNIIDNQPSFIHGSKAFESAKRAYVVNRPVITVTDSTGAHISSIAPTSSSKMCLINAGVISGGKTAMVVNIGTQTGGKSIFLYGPAITSNKLCYIRGSWVIDTHFAYVRGT